MTASYQPDSPGDPLDLMIMAQAQAEPVYDVVAADFLHQSHHELSDRCRRGGLLAFTSLGRTVPWLYRLTFATRGLGRVGDDGEIQTADSHTILLHFLPDYLRRANRFEMLQYVAPREPAPWHPNICPKTGAICLEVYPRESLITIVESLHDLLRWRIRQLNEQDALNKAACAYGRNFVPTAIDDRPLFGRAWNLQMDPVEAE